MVDTLISLRGTLLQTRLTPAWGKSLATFRGDRSDRDDGLPTPPARIPLIHCADLFHSPQDPDDHVDLATVLALQQFDIHAIILDQGASQVPPPEKFRQNKPGFLQAGELPTPPASQLRAVIQKKWVKPVSAVSMSIKGR